MKTLLVITSIALFSTAYSEPLIIVKPEGEERKQQENANIEETLAKEFPDARISIRAIEVLNQESIKNFIPQGKFDRVSAVIADPETKHAALLEFVIFNQEGESIVLPMAGDHSEFSSLLQKTNVRLRNVSDATAAGRAYAAVYRLKLASAPEVFSREEGYQITLPVTKTIKENDARIDIELNIEVDDERRARKVVVGTDFVDPTSQETKKHNKSEQATPSKPSD